MTFDAFIDSLGVESRDRLIVHSNVGLGLGATGLDQVSNFLDALERRVGQRGLIALPAFTYSFGKGEDFDPNQRVSGDMGALSAVAFKRPYLRVRDPMFRFLVRGDDAKSMQPIVNSSFGPLGTFGRFFNRGFKVLSIGLDFGTTLVHEMEFRLRVRYRTLKEFTGFIVEDESRISASWTTFVRDLNDDASYPNFSKLNHLMRTDGDFQSSLLGRRESLCWSLDGMFQIVRDRLPEEPDLLLKNSK